jgi:hypothetical protein
MTNLDPETLLSRKERDAEIAQRWLNLNPNTLLRTDELAVGLTAIGYKASPATVMTWRSRGGGPPFEIHGRTPLYRLADVLEWLRERPKRKSTAEYKRADRQRSPKPKSPATTLVPEASAFAQRSEQSIDVGDSPDILKRKAR